MLLYLSYWKVDLKITHCIFFYVITLLCNKICKSFLKVPRVELTSSAFYELIENTNIYEITPPIAA